MEIKAGDTIRILKGTPIKSCGKVRNKVAGKTYDVTVHHTLTGVCVTANTALNDRHYKYDLEKYGIDENALIALRESNDRAFYQNRNIMISPPSVCWPGTGGYWHEVDVNLVTKVAV